MDYAKPAEVVKAMIEASRTKLALSPRDLLIRGALSGALLGTATSFAITGAVTTGQPLVGALIFPVGLVIIVILGLELVTGSFALLPLRGPGAPILAGIGDRELGLGVPRQSPRQHRLRCSARHRAHQFLARRADRRRRPHRRRRGSQDRRLRGAGRRRHDGRLRQGDAVQLAGLLRRRHGHDLVLDHRQAGRRLAPDLGVLRARLRAHGGEHVHHPDRNADGRQGHGLGLVAVEPDSGDARQSGRRLRIHRPRPLRHLQAGDARRS